MKRALLAASCVCLVLAGCGTQPSDSKATDTGDGPGGEELYEGTGLVLEDGRRPELCLGVVLESLPPQCDGEPITNWDWDAVDGEDRSGDVVWGDYHVVGTYDGKTFSVVEAGPPEYDEGDDDSTGTPCDPPPGGWERIDQTNHDPEDMSEVVDFFEDREGFAGAWVDYIGITPEELDRELMSPGDSSADADWTVVLMLAFTEGNLPDEAEVRERWDGGICLVTRPNTEAELLRIQREVGEFAVKLGLEGLGSDTDISEHVVRLRVVWIDEEARRKIEERFGGVVEIDAALEPVD